MFKKVVASTLSLLMILPSPLAFAKPMSFAESDIQEKIVSPALNYFVESYQSGQSPADLAAVFMDHQSDTNIQTMRYFANDIKSLPTVKREGSVLVFTHKNKTATLEVVDIAKNKFRINGKIFVLDPTAPIELTLEVIEKNYLSPKSAGLMQVLIPEAHALGDAHRLKSTRQAKRALTPDEIKKKAEDEALAEFNRKLNNSWFKKARDWIDAHPFSFALTLGIAAITGAVAWAGYSSTMNMLCEMRAKADPKVVEEMDPEGLCKPYLQRISKKTDLCKGPKDTIQLTSDQNPDKSWTQWTGYFEPDKPFEIKEVELGEDKKTVTKVLKQLYMKEDPKTGEKQLIKIINDEKFVITKENLKTQEDKQLWADYTVMAEYIKSAMIECAQEKYKSKIEGSKQQVNSKSFSSPSPSTNSKSNAR